LPVHELLVQVRARVEARDEVAEVDLLEADRADRVVAEGEARDRLLGERRRRAFLHGLVGPVLPPPREAAAPRRDDVEERLVALDPVHEVADDDEEAPRVERLELGRLLGEEAERALGALARDEAGQARPRAPRPAARRRREEARARARPGRRAPRARSPR